ncbi:dynamin-binding protein isoform X2 [Patella vulgata]|uniref:dynamin-binding protein isoform X2 n=1 Tax=Patella vulgata TaxID=6465 RepID=UPI00217FFF53|nr:dynamin-binding protein isoform X2 [Patella vulgata]
MTTGNLSSDQIETSYADDSTSVTQVKMSGVTTMTLTPTMSEMDVNSLIPSATELSVSPSESTESTDKLASSYSNILLTSSDVQYNNDINSLSVSNTQEIIMYDQSFLSASMSSGVSPSISISTMTDPVTSQNHNSLISITSSMQTPSQNDIIVSSSMINVLPDSRTLPSASVTLSSIQPSSTFQGGSSTSAIVSSPGIGFTSDTSNIISSSTSTPGTSERKFDFTVLYIALPVSFIIILIVLIASFVGYNKRKKKRFTMRSDSRDLWMNPVSDISLQPNSISSNNVGGQSTEQPTQSTTTVNNKNIAELDSKGIKIYRVVYPFDATLETQISLQKDDVVSVTEQAENGWFRGEVLGKTGWFPSSYVEEIKPPTLLEKMENESSLKKKSRVTSFLLKKKDKQRKRSRREQIEDDEDEVDDSEKDSGFVAEVINMSDIGSTVPIEVDDIDITQTSTGKLFKAVFMYKPACKGEIGLLEGDIIICKDRDRNGWMSGLNMRTNEDGWFPAVYVNEASEEDIPAEPTPKPVTYDRLTANKNRTSNQEGIGIEHKALYSYSSLKSEDLQFEAGDTIVVFETLDNGWWLGCHGDEVGWFPGSYVELADKSDDSSSNASSGIKNFSIFDDIDLASLKSDRSSAITLDGLPDGDKDLKNSDEKSKLKKRESKSALSADFKPARKAPAPPPGSTKVLPSGLKTGSLGQSNESLLENKENKTNIKSSEKPELPVRFVKRKLVKVPKNNTKKLRNLAVLPLPNERPLPPRPPPPKINNHSKYKKNKPKQNTNKSNSNQLINDPVTNNGGIDALAESPACQKRKSKPPKPPTRTQGVEPSEPKTERHSLDVSLYSNEESLNNSIGPKILNRISAHLLDEVTDNTMTPKTAAKLRKVAPPVIPPLMNGDNKENCIEENGNEREIMDDNDDVIQNELPSQNSPTKPPPPKSSPPKPHRNNQLNHEDPPEIPNVRNLVGVSVC